MTSGRKIAASRLNGRKSRGPRNAAGKWIASRNALRHGLAAATHRQPASPIDIERLAEALCGNDKDPALLAQARVIANNALVLRAISAQQLAVAERVRDSRFIAFARGNEVLKLAKVRFREIQDAWDQIVALRAKLLEKYKNELPPPIITPEMEEMIPEMDRLIPPHLQIFLEEKEKELAAKGLNPGETKVKGIAAGLEGRDESRALEEAALDLIRLDRYERRASSRQKHAVFAFMNIKLMMQLGSQAKLH